MAFLHELPIAELIANYGYIAIFVIITLESAGLPLPGETILLTAAAYAGSAGNLSIALIVGAAASAAIIGDNVGYWVGRRWGLPLLMRHGKKIGLDHGRLKLGQYLFRQHGGKIVFFGRFTAMLRAYAAVLAGVNQLDARRFFAFNALGGVAWASIMGFGAYLCGRSIENVMGPVGLVLLGFVVLGAVALWLFMRRHEARLMAAAEAAIPGALIEGASDLAPSIEPSARSTHSPDNVRVTQPIARTQTSPLPFWFKIPVTLFAAATGMVWASEHIGATGGFYGRLIGHIGERGVWLILLSAGVVLVVLARRLGSVEIALSPDEQIEEQSRLAA